MRRDILKVKQEIIRTEKELLVCLRELWRDRPALRKEIEECAGGCEQAISFEKEEIRILKQAGDTV